MVITWFIANDSGKVKINSVNVESTWDSLIEQSVLLTGKIYKIFNKEGFYFYGIRPPKSTKCYRRFTSKHLFIYFCFGSVKS